MKNVRNCTVPEAIRIRRTEISLKLQRIKEIVTDPKRYHPDGKVDWGHVGDLTEVLEDLEHAHFWLVLVGRHSCARRMAAGRKCRSVIERSPRRQAVDL